MKTKNAAPRHRSGRGQSSARSRSGRPGALPVPIPGPGQVQDRLKAERVQEALTALPGWGLAPGGRAIDRVRTFASPGAAACYASFALKLAGCHQQPVALSLSAGQVVLTLSGPPRQGAQGGLTAAVFDLAASLG